MSILVKMHFYTFNNGNILYKGLVEIQKDWYINECPIEDFGDYLVLPENEYIPKEQAFDMYLELINKQKGGGLNE